MADEQEIIEEDDAEYCGGNTIYNNVDTQKNENIEYDVAMEEQNMEQEEIQD